MFWGDEIEKIQTIDPQTGIILSELEQFNIYPANIFVTTKERAQTAVDQASS